MDFTSIDLKKKKKGGKEKRRSLKHVYKKTRDVRGGNKFLEERTRMEMQKCGTISLGFRRKGKLKKEGKNNHK